MPQAVADQPDAYEIFLRKLNTYGFIGDANIEGAKAATGRTDGDEYGFNAAWGTGDDPKGGDGYSNSADSSFASIVRNSQSLNSLYQNQVFGSSAWIDPNKDARLSSYLGGPATQPNIADAQSQFKALGARADALATKPKTLENIIALQDARLSQQQIGGEVVWTGAASQSRGGDVGAGLQATGSAIVQRAELRKFVGQQLGLTPDQLASLNTMSTEEYSAFIDKSLAGKSKEERNKITAALATKTDEMKAKMAIDPANSKQGEVKTFDLENPVLATPASGPSHTSTSAASDLHDGGDIQTTKNPTTPFNQASLFVPVDSIPAPAPTQTPAPQQQIAPAPAAPHP